MKIESLGNPKTEKSLVGPELTRGRFSWYRMQRDDEVRFQLRSRQTDRQTDADFDDQKGQYAVNSHDTIGAERLVGLRLRYCSRSEGSINLRFG